MSVKKKRMYSAKIMWITYCISGKLRSAACTYENIFETMIHPLENISHDIFLHLGITSNASDDTVAMRNLVDYFRPKNSSLTTTTHMTTGLELCRRDIHRTESIERKQYAVIIRVRPDVVYETTIPSFPNDFQTNILITPADTLRPQSAPTRWFVSDIWAIVPRRLLDVYFSNSRQGLAASACKQTGPGKSFNEFDLGCTMMLANESVLVLKDISFKKNAWIVCLRDDMLCAKKRQPFLYCPHRKNATSTISLSRAERVAPFTSRFA